MFTLEDRRVRKTKNLLKETLVELIGEMAYDKITVTEICDRADYISFSENNVGLKYVLINGRIVLEGGVYNGTRAAFVKTVFKE